jgi:hypothetical protein
MPVRMRWYDDPEIENLAGTRHPRRREKTAVQPRGDARQRSEEHRVDHAQRVTDQSHVSETDRRRECRVPAGASIRRRESSQAGDDACRRVFVGGTPAA